MILRTPLLRATTSSTCTIPSTRSNTRALHHLIPVRPIPPPTPFIPDTTTFLTAIGRSLSAHAAKIPSWDALFTLSSSQLRELGIEPARSRRYLLHWREKFRNGEYGIGGDCTHVEDGVAHLRVVEAEVGGRDGGMGEGGVKMSRRTKMATATHTPGTRRVVINVPAGMDTAPSAESLRDVKGVQGVVVKGTRNIAGPYVEMIKGTGGLAARIKMQEGLWEERRGHKVDGGERRQAEVRAKRRAQENKENKR